MHADRDTVHHISIGRCAGLTGISANTLRRYDEIGLYHNPLQWYLGLDVEVCLPLDRTVAAALGGRRLPGGAAMRTVYLGPWDDIWHAYAAMLARIARKGYEVTWPVQPRATSFD